MLHEKFQIHFPDPRHLIQQNQRALEERIDLAIFGGEHGRVEGSDMFHPEGQVGFPQLVRPRKLDAGALHDEGLFKERPMTSLEVDI